MTPVVALLMAGGRGTRMRESGVDVPKPLVIVRGRTLLEWNFRALVQHGVDEVVVSVSSPDDPVAVWILQNLLPLAAREKCRVEVLSEPRPLGNIGAAGLLHGRSGALLVVYADNLTTLNLRAVVAHHDASGAALTLACHEQPFRIPYGQLMVEGGRVTAYREKPHLPVTVCSAVSVLGPAATARCGGNRPTGLVDLTTALLDAGEHVSAFPHNSPWVDVNDAQGAAQAEAMLDALSTGSW